MEQHEVACGVSCQLSRQDDPRGWQFQHADKAGCESRDGMLTPAFASREFHQDRQHRTVRSCTSDSVKYPTLGVERRAVNLSRAAGFGALEDGLLLGREGS